jgi:hypothetical protein
MHDEYTPLRETPASVLTWLPDLDTHRHGFEKQSTHSLCFSCNDVWSYLFASNSNAHLLHLSPFITLPQCAHIFCVCGRVHLGHLSHVGHGAHRGHFVRGGHTVGLHVGHLEVFIDGSLSLDSGFLSLYVVQLIGPINLEKHPHPIMYSVTITNITTAAATIPCFILHLISPFLHVIKLYIVAG